MRMLAIRLLYVSATSQIDVFSYEVLRFDIIPQFSYISQANGASLRHYLFRNAGRYRSGQPGQTVNLLAYAFVGSNPT